jgi:hypothetical protein
LEKILMGAPLEKQDKKAVVESQIGGWKPAEDYLDFRGSDTSLPIALRMWSQQVGRLASGEEGSDLLDAIGPVTKSRDELKAYWLQEMGRIWQEATSKPPTSNKARDGRTEWRSPFHCFAQAAWEHMSYLLSEDKSEIGSPDTVKRLLSPAQDSWES